MGYGYYEIGGMRRGYSVRCKCHKRGCQERIDRGLSYLCASCTWYFCGKHLTCAYDNNDEPIRFDCFAGKAAECQCCERCRSIAERDAKAESQHPVAQRGMHDGS